MLKVFFINANYLTIRLLLLLAVLGDFPFVYAERPSLSLLKGSDTIVNDDKSAFKSIIEERKTISGKSFTTALNPQAVSFVQEYVKKQGKELERMRIWGKPYFDLYDNILTECGIPKELKYLSVIESHLQPNLVSWAGAVGPWQLMDYEAHRFGLRTGKYLDDRTDFHKSTYVAAKLIKQLYDEFGDWLLVVAAYNGGAGRVRQAIQKSGSRDFWRLQYLLPEETRTHVKKYIGTHYLFEGGGGPTTMTAGEMKEFLTHPPASAAALNGSPAGGDYSNTDVIEIGGHYNSGVIIKELSLDAGQFHKWNPGLDKVLAEGKKYPLRLTKDKLALFEERKKDILLSSIQGLLEGTMQSYVR
jgi:membrane-bound lytic murein transglycosylase D